MADNDPGAKPDPKPGDGKPDPDPKPGGGKPDPGDDVELGEAGKAALDAERRAHREAERARKALQTELDELKKKTMTDSERAVAEAKAEGRKEALAEANSKLLRAEIRTAAADKLADPGDAAVLLGDIDRFLDKDGEPDSKAIASAIDALVKAKPYLAKAGSRQAPLSGGGAKPSSGLSINDDIRARAGR